jgi:hypothetical protein
LFSWALLLQAVSVTAILAAEHAHVSSPWPYAVCAGLNQIGSSTYLLSWTSGLRFVFGDKAASYRATLNSLFFATRVAGPAATSLLLPFTGYGGILVVDLVSFLFPFLLQISRVGGVSVPVHPSAARSSVRRRMVDGFTLLRGHPLLRALLINRFFVAIVTSSGFTVFVVHWYKTDRLWTDSSVTWLLLGLGVSTQAGNMLTKRLALGSPLVCALLSVAVLCPGMLLCMTGNQLITVGFLVVMFAAGMSMTLQVISVTTLSEPRSIGLISGVFGLGTGISAVVGSAVTGALVDHQQHGVYPAILLALSAISAVPLVVVWTRNGVTATSGNG